MAIDDNRVRRFFKREKRNAEKAVKVAKKDMKRAVHDVENAFRPTWYQRVWIKKRYSRKIIKSMTRSISDLTIYPTTQNEIRWIYFIRENIQEKSMEIDRSINRKNRSHEATFRKMRTTP
ncbi:hypothetical protein DICVIV_04869 [Dictyocaulus viviparus]|uniref:Uncharacterized protein n=1 Tax=Dictyocaulus viviparus TaxID=29172 RepID=A0A0D8XWS9_DICVI|nr:hypothetical protein DICVIV_04869 [Dictyocaulus viviparus]